MTKFPVVALNEVADFTRGLTYTKSDEVDFSSNIVLRANNVDLNSGTILYEDLKYLRDSFVIPSEKKVQSGSLIICTASGSKSHLGKVALIPDSIDMAFGGFMGMLRPKDVLDGRFLYYALRSPAYLDFISQATDGANINNLKFSDLGLFEFPLPPLDEQKRIVAKLDEAMSDLNCVEKQTSEIGDLAALFTSAVLSEEFAVSSKWPIVPLSDLTTVLTDGDWVESKDQSPSGIRLLQTGNVGLGRFRANDNRARYISAETFERLNCTEVVAGDVLISRLPDPIGRACVIPELNERTITAVDCAVLRFKESIIPELFVYYSQSSDYLQTAEAKATGSTRQRISRSNLSQIQIPLPPLDEQKRIVAKLDEISECSSMRKDLQNRRTESIAKLKSVILAAAFAGNL